MIKRQEAGCLMLILTVAMFVSGTTVFISHRAELWWFGPVIVGAVLVSVAYIMAFAALMAKDLEEEE